jgi:hypothetical protein
VGRKYDGYAKMDMNGKQQFIIERMAEVVLIVLEKEKCNSLLFSG